MCGQAKTDSWGSAASSRYRRGDSSSEVRHGRQKLHLGQRPRGIIFSRATTRPTIGKYLPPTTPAASGCRRSDVRQMGLELKHSARLAPVVHARCPEAGCPTRNRPALCFCHCSRSKPACTELDGICFPCRWGHASLFLQSHASSTTTERRQSNGTFRFYFPFSRSFSFSFLLLLTAH